MSLPLSAECILISAILNNQDVANATSFGVSPVHFLGYKDEYNWLLTYVEQYGTEPTKDAFAHAFPNFYFSDHEDIRSACDMVFKAYAKRQMTTAMSEAVDLLELGDVHEAHRLLVKAEPRRTSPKPRRLLTDLTFLDDWETRYRGVEVPYQTLQRHTGGIQAGNIWYLAARPKQGKTAHLVNMVKHAVKTGNRVLFYSLEMSEAEVRARFHAALAHEERETKFHQITLTKLRNRDVDSKVYKEFVQLLQERFEQWGGTLDIHTPRDGIPSPSLIATRASEYHLNVVDYIGLMRSDTGARSVDDWRIAASISNDLKLLAGTGSTSLLVAAQINREGEMGHEPPKIKNLAQSDALGQDGDVILTLRARPHNVASHFSIEGNRHGESGVRFHTIFDPNRGIFDEISADRAEDLVVEAEV
jgi:replicative DNA helicase